MNERIFVLLELLSRLIIHKCIVPSVDGGDVSGGMNSCLGDVVFVVLFVKMWMVVWWCER